MKDNRCIHAVNNVCTNANMLDGRTILPACCGMNDGGDNDCPGHEDQYSCAKCGRLITNDTDGTPNGYDNPDGTVNSYICEDCMKGSTQYA